MQDVEGRGGVFGKKDWNIAAGCGHIVRNYPVI
jgi:hypothetical protein